MIKCRNCGIEYSELIEACPYCDTVNHIVKKKNRSNQSRQNQDNTSNDGDSIFTYNNIGFDNCYTPRKLEFYEEGWFIALAFIFFFPAGIALLILRGQNDNKYDRNTNGQGRYYGSTKKQKHGKSKTVLFFFLALIGVSLLGEALEGDNLLVNIFLGTGCAGYGAYGILKPIYYKRRKAMYESVIDNRGNTKISDIARKLGKKESKVRIELQTLINYGMLNEPEHNISAYIDGNFDLLVMTRNGKPIVPVEKTMEDEIRSREAEAARKEAEGSIEKQFILMLQDAKKLTVDKEVVGYYEEMEISMTNILKLIDENPDTSKRNDIKKLQSSYIPSTIELIEKYSSKTTSDSTKHQIKGMLHTIKTALGNLEKQLQEKNDMGTEVDIEVLKRKLAQDGLLGMDFDIK